MRKRRPEQPEEESPEVKLKPFLGMQPGLYLTIIYGALLVIILFLLFFNPGLRRNGSKVAFTSRPSSAAVYVDDVFAGTTPVKVFVESGDRRIIISRPSYLPDERTLKIGGRIFASLIFPRRARIAANLILENPENHLRETLRDYSAWGLIDRFSANYQPPRLLSNTMETLFTGSAGIEPVPKDLINRFLYAAIPSTTNEVLLGDLVRASVLAASTGGVPSASSISTLLQNFIQLAQKYQNLPFWIYAISRAEVREWVDGMEWFEEHINSYQSILPGPEVGLPPNDLPQIGGFTSIAGHRFFRIPEGSFIQGLFSPGNVGGQHPFATNSGGFLMLNTEVTKRWYGDFVQAETDWGADNRDRLVEAGLVTAEYLKDWDNGADDFMPVRYVSYYAAKAFCDWLQKELPQYEVRLPTESEWEWAALLTTEIPDDYAIVFNRVTPNPEAVDPTGEIQGILGNLWEWNENWYYPVSYFASSWVGETGVFVPDFDVGAEKAVRGGSYANIIEDRIGISTRGSQPPDWCTPFLGFRIVLVER